MVRRSLNRRNGEKRRRSMRGGSAKKTGWASRLATAARRQLGRRERSQAVAPAEENIEQFIGEIMKPKKKKTF